MDTRNDRIPKSSEEEYSPEQKDLVIPVLEEQVVVAKDTIETGKILIRKRVHEEEVSVNLPIIEEGYEVERKTVDKQLLAEPPAVRHEEGNMIIPVVREVMVVEKRYEVIEEIHVRKTRSEIPNQEQVTLRKESVDITRESSTR